MQSSSKVATIGLARHRDLTRVAELFEQHPKTISILWKECSRQKADGVVDPDLHSKCKGDSDQDSIDLDSLREALRYPSKTTPHRSVGATLGVLQSTLCANKPHEVRPTLVLEDLQVIAH